MSGKELLLCATADEGSRTLVSSLEGWGNEPLYDYRKSDTTISKTAECVNGACCLCTEINFVRALFKKLIKW